MPNWCYNYMTLSGSKREIRRFIKDITVSADEYDMNQLAPLDPRAVKEVKRTKPDGTEVTLGVFASSETEGFDGYHEALEHWGSKWGACRIEVDKDIPNNPTIRYESAWSLCTPLIQKISTLYPNVIFSVVSTEESNAFAVSEIIHNGEVINEQSVDPTQYPPELQEIVEKAEKDESEEAWEAWYDAESEWNNHIWDVIHDECSLVTKDYIKHLSRSKRRIREGKETEIFIPLT